MLNTHARRPNAPGPRNAATLTPIDSGDDTSSTRLLLHGGWHPFVNTFGDSFVLTVDA